MVPYAVAISFFFQKSNGGAGQTNGQDPGKLEAISVLTEKLLNAVTRFSEGFPEAGEYCDVRLLVINLVKSEVC